MTPVGRLSARPWPNPCFRVAPTAVPRGRCRSAEYGAFMATIATVTTAAQRLVVRRLFGEYQRSVERLLNGTDVCP